MLLKLTDADDGWPVYIESQNILDRREDARHQGTSLVVCDEGSVLNVSVRESLSEIDRLLPETDEADDPTDFSGIEYAGAMSSSSRPGARPAG